MFVSKMSHSVFRNCWFLIANKNQANFTLRAAAVIDAASHHVMRLLFNFLLKLRSREYMKVIYARS